MTVEDFIRSRKIKCACYLSQRRGDYQYSYWIKSAKQFGFFWDYKTDPIEMLKYIIKEAKMVNGGYFIDWLIAKGYPHEIKQTEVYIKGTDSTRMSEKIICSDEHRAEHRTIDTISERLERWLGEDDYRRLLRTHDGGHDDEIGSRDAVGKTAPSA